MPYTIKQNTKKEFCVHKKGENDEPMGDSLGCHKTKKEAVGQIAAIESKENEKMTDVHYLEIKGDITLSNVDWDTYTNSTDDVWYTIASDGNIIPLNEIPVKKAFSFDAYRDMIYQAWEKDHSYDLWIYEVFDEFIIAYDSNEKTHYKVTYSVMNGDTVEFVKQNAWEEVRMKKEWIAKALSMSSRINFEKYIGADVSDDLYAIKALGGGRIGGYAMIWGDEENKDLHGEFFTPNTKDLTTVFDEMKVLPFIVHHAGDDGVTKFVGGAIDVLEPDDIGLWFEAKTKEFEAYSTYVKPLMSKKMLFASSGTLPAAKRANKSTGEITRWAIAEVSGTWTPAEYRMLEYPLTDIKSAFAELGVDFPDKESQEDDSEKTNEKTLGAEKARLKSLVKQELLKLGLLELD